MERTIDNPLYASRWLLAPIYIGLSLALLALVRGLEVSVTLKAPLRCRDKAHFAGNGKPFPK